MLIIGNKYVPHSKSVNGSLHYSAAFRRARESNKSYLYYNGQDTCGHYFNDTNNKTGDYFLESDVTPYVEEFILPEKWCVKVTVDNAEELTLWKMKVSDNKWSYSALAYEYISMTGEGIRSHINSLYTEITWEQFKTHVLKQTDMQKLIGYKLIKPEYKEAAKQITASSCNWRDPKKDGFDLSVIEDVSIPKLQDAGVLDLWFEKVYEEELKVGDWVKWSGVTPVVAQLTRKESDGYWALNAEGYTCCSQAHLRLATAEEIENAQTITMGGYKAELSGGQIKFGCQFFSKETLEVLIQLKSRVEFEFNCTANNLEISLETLKKLYAKFP